MNPNKKTDFIIQNLRVSCHFTSVDDIKVQIISSCEGKVPEDLSNLGTRLLEVRRKDGFDDVKDMYHEYSGKQEILL